MTTKIERNKLTFAKLPRLQEISVDNEKGYFRHLLAHSSLSPDSFEDWTRLKRKVATAAAFGQYDFGYKPLFQKEESDLKLYLYRATTQLAASSATRTEALPATRTNAPPATKTTAPPATKTTAPAATKTTAPAATRSNAPPGPRATAPPATKTLAPPTKCGHTRSPGNTQPCRDTQGLTKVQAGDSCVPAAGKEKCMGWGVASDLCEAHVDN